MYDRVVTNVCSAMPGKQCNAGNEVRTVGKGAFAESGTAASFLALVVNSASDSFNVAQNAFEEFRGTVKVFDAVAVDEQQKGPTGGWSHDHSDFFQSTKWASFAGSASVYRVIDRIGQGSGGNDEQPRPSSWREAAEKCKLFGGGARLATMDSSAERLFLDKLLNASEATGYETKLFRTHHKNPAGLAWIGCSEKSQRTDYYHWGGTEAAQFADSCASACGERRKMTYTRLNTFI